MTPEERARTMIHEFCAEQWDKGYEATVPLWFPEIHVPIAQAIRAAVAEAVAAEREACCAAICGLCAGINPLYGPAEYAQRSLLGNRWFWEHPFVEDEKESREPGLRAVPCQAAAIRARGGGENGSTD